MKYNLIYIFLFLFSFTKAQNAEITKIENLIEESFINFSYQEYQRSYQHAENSFKISKKINFSSGIVRSLLYKAKVLIELGMYQDAINCLTEVYDEKAFSGNPMYQTEAHRIKGRAYGYLHLHELAIREFKLQAEKALKIPDPTNSKLSTLWAYQNMEYIFEQTMNQEGLNKSLALQEQTLNKLDSNIFYHEYANFYTSKASNLIRQKKYDEASNYLQKSLYILEKNESKALYSVYLTFANLYEEKKDINQASHYFQLALENAEILGDLNAESNVSKSYGDFLIANNTNKQLAQILIINYNDYKDSLNKANKYAVDGIVMSMVKNKNIEDLTMKGTYWFTFLTILSILFYIHYFCFKKPLAKNFNLPKKQAQNIATNNPENININFNDLIESAKNNSPEFLFAFESAYPEVVNNIKEMTPNMRSSELYFLVLSFLNFTPKEIARCTNVTVRAVQIRKNRYRKKYNIPSEADFNIWIKQEIDRKI